MKNCVMLLRLNAPDVSCARHNAYVPIDLCDMDKGEVLGLSMSHLEHLPPFVIGGYFCLMFGNISESDLEKKWRQTNPKTKEKIASYSFYGKDDKALQPRRGSLAWFHDQSLVLAMRAFYWDITAKPYDEHAADDGDLTIRKHYSAPVDFGSILLVGPPGIGKTHYARHISTMLGSVLHIVSAGGLRDNDTMRITGSTRGYADARPGLWAFAMRDGLMGVRNA